MPEDDLHTADNLIYRRKGGGGLGFDYKVTKDFTFSAAYSYTDAKIKDNLYSEKDYHQQLSGTALTAAEQLVHRRHRQLLQRLCAEHPPAHAVALLRR